MTTNENSTCSIASAIQPILNTTNRPCQTVPAPPTVRLDVDDLFSNPSDPKDKPNLEVLKQHILLEGRLTDEAAIRIIETGRSSS
jgi:serine/threonine-protein phosphatase 2B catalytic subunit